MLAQILVAILTVAVVVMVGVDLVRTGNEDPSGLHDGWGDDRTGVPRQEPFGTGIPGRGDSPGRAEPRPDPS